MASKYRVPISRCSLVIANAKSYPVRYISQIGPSSLKHIDKHKNNGRLLAKVTHISSLFLDCSRFSTVSPSITRLSFLNINKGPRNAPVSRTAVNAQELLSSYLKHDEMRGCCTGLCSCTQTRGMAGHSHYQNTKHIKAAGDAEKSAQSQKLKRDVIGLIKVGGPDPKYNTKLAKRLEQGIKSGVPKVKVMEMLSSATAKHKKSTTQYVCAIGPLRTMFVIEVYTDAASRTRQELGTILKKNGGAVTNDSGKQAFEEKGIVEVPVTEDMEPVDMDKYLEVAIETGAEDVILSEEDNDDEGPKKVLKFHCNSLHMLGVKKKIEEHDLEVSSAEVDFMPRQWVTLEGPELEVVDKIYYSLNRHEAVVKIFDNVTTPDE